MHAKTWLNDAGSAGARVLTGSVNSTAHGLSNNYGLLVELKGETVALEFCAAIEECWSKARTSDASAEAFDKRIAQAAAGKQSQGRGAGSAQFGFRTRQTRTLKIQRIPMRIEEQRTQS